MTRTRLNTLQTLDLGRQRRGRFHSLPALARHFPNVARLPVSLRIVLESVLRHLDDRKITRDHVAELAQWRPQAARTQEIPFVVARVLLQDFTGVPLLADLAAMRQVAQSMGRSPGQIEPRVPVDLVVDHSVMIDHFRGAKALDLNMQLEFRRNKERYQFLKWGMQAFDTFRVVPPGVGIVHQVNLEYLARGVHHDAQGLYYPDTLVGTDSHTTMINGLGVVGWGVGGIEAEAAMLGQPVYLLMPDVVGVELTGVLREGCTATDLVLTLTELLRSRKVVGKFVEFFGEGTHQLNLPDRATIANMAPEYGATLGFFPVDDHAASYLRNTGRSPAEVNAFKRYFKAQELYGVPGADNIDYSEVIRLDLGSVAPSLAGPKRPQDRITISDLSGSFERLFSEPPSANGFNQPAARLHQRHRTRDGLEVGHGDILIAAITSCTNTSNPDVMLAAGLLARKAVKAGLKIQPHIKTSLAPGSRVVTEYLARAGLLKDLEALGFNVSAYGCTTCIGNAGDLSPGLNETIVGQDLVCAAVLSGNRNFEARIHPNLKANFLASPPLVVAYAIAGTVTRDLMTQPLGQGKGGRDIYLGDVWPSSEEIDALRHHAMDPEAYRANYARIRTNPGPLWQAIAGSKGQVYTWPASSYIARPPFLDDFSMQPELRAQPLRGARALALFGDSITTDHISPAGTIDEPGPAGQWLLAQGIAKGDFNSFGARRGHHEVMVRGTFANVRIKNLMLPPRADGSREEGGFTLHQPDGERLTIHETAMRYQRDGVAALIFAGEEYGTGSSRDWAAKGTRLLGVKAVIARSFERIHRSNLVGMGVLPLQFKGDDAWQRLGIRGDEQFDLNMPALPRARQDVDLLIHHRDGRRQVVSLRLRIDTDVEVDYFLHGGILPFVLRELLR